MKKKIIIIVNVCIIACILYLLFATTGFLQEGSIDDKDLKYWSYDDGIIEGAEEFKINGNNEYCWLMIHGYNSSPRVFRELANKINKKFGDGIYTIRLAGHGKIPSHLRGKNLNIWYKQVKDRYHSLNCERVNVVGSSFGGALSLRLAQQEELNNVYLLAPFLFTSLEPLLIFSGVLNYLKKAKIGPINDPWGMKNHISYWRFVLPPVRDSMDFLKETKSGISNIEENVLIMHSKDDKISHYSNSKYIYENLRGDKKLISFTKSNHILLMDYDRKKVIKNIIKFRIW